MRYRRRSGGIARSAPRARFRLGLVASRGRCRRFIFGSLEGFWDCGESRNPRSRDQPGHSRPNRRVTGPSLAVAGEVSLEEPEIAYCIDQGDQVTADLICKRRRDVALIDGCPVEEVRDGIEGCGGGFEVFIQGVHAVTQKDVVDAVRFVAKEFRHVHIHRGGSRGRSGRASRGGRDDDRGCRGRSLDRGGTAR